MAKIKTTTCEEWRPVVKYKKWYSISSTGRLKRIKACSGATVGRIQKFAEDADGYYRVHLSKHRKVRIFYVHTLVAKSFIGPQPKNKQVNHIDGNKKNNTPENLEYVTCSENAKHAFRLNLRKKGSKHHKAKLTENKVKYIRKQKEKQTLRQLAQKFKVTFSTIQKAMNYITWTHVM